MKKLFAVLGIALALTACTNAKKEEAIRQAAIKATRDSMRVDSFKKAEVAQKELAVKQAEAQAEEKRILMLSEARAAENAPAARMAGTSNTSTTTTTTTKKKGWSSAALGTVIGAGAGGLAVDRVLVESHRSGAQGSGEQLAVDRGIGLGIDRRGREHGADEVGSDSDRR